MVVTDILYSCVKKSKLRIGHFLDELSYLSQINPFIVKQGDKDPETYRPICLYSNREEVYFLEGT